MTKSRPLIDTDEQKAIDDAVERAAFSEMEIKQMATDACEVFHEKHCPAKDLGGKLDKFVGEFVEFRGEIRGQLRMVLWGVPALLTLGGMLVAGTWAIANRATTRHAQWSVISSAQASTVDAAKTP